MKIVSHSPVIVFLIVLSFAAAVTGCKKNDKLAELHQENVERARKYRDYMELAGDRQQRDEAMRGLRKAEEGRDDYDRSQN